jgi:hypothetical protein
MLVNQAYYELNLLVNKSSERKNIQIGKDNFVLLFNRESQRWLAEFIEKNLNSDNILTIGELLVHEKKLEKLSTKTNHVHYKLPDDYFQLLAGNSYSKVKKDSCEGIVYNYFKKPNDLNIQIEDKFLQPSFEWERGLGEIFSEGISIYKTNFDIIDTYISYYKNVPEIDMEGYIKFDGSMSKDIHPQISDYLVGQILDRVAIEILREFNDQVGFQLGQTRKEITI